MCVWIRANECHAELILISQFLLLPVLAFFAEAGKRPAFVSRGGGGVHLSSGLCRGCPGNRETSACLGGMSREDWKAADAFFCAPSFEVGQMAPPSQGVGKDAL